MANPDASCAQLEAALDCCCTEPGARQAAMELVVALMAPSASNFELGFGVLNDIHFRPGPILVTKADISALDNLRQPGGYVGLRNGGATCYMNAGTFVFLK